MVLLLDDLVVVMLAPIVGHDLIHESVENYIG